MGTFLRASAAVAAVILSALGSSSAASGSGSSRSGGETLIACLQDHEFVYSSRPSACSFFARQYYPDGRLRRFRDVGVKDLRWSGWGTRVAIGSGKSIFAYPMTVVASRRTFCPDGNWYYAHVFTHGKVGRDQQLRLAGVEQRGSSRWGPNSFVELTVTTARLGQCGT
jgi:hypothetical protein